MVSWSYGLAWPPPNRSITVRLLEQQRHGGRMEVVDSPDNTNQPVNVDGGWTGLGIPEDNGERAVRTTSPQRSSVQLTSAFAPWTTSGSCWNLSSAGKVH